MKTQGGGLPPVTQVNYATFLTRPSAVDTSVLKNSDASTCYKIFHTRRGMCILITSILTIIFGIVGTVKVSGQNKYGTDGAAYFVGTAFSFLLDFILIISFCRAYCRRKEDLLLTRV